MVALGAETGLRARKKQRTRAAIAAAAFDLFARRGFEAVTVAEVARRAEVSEATVFNYFRTKEELVYGPLEEFWSEMLAAVRDRDPAQSVAGAFRDFLLHRRPLGRTPEEREALARMTRIITRSPALLAREREVCAEGARALADLIAAEVGARPGDIRPWVVAHALMGVHQALVTFSREWVLAGVSGPALARRLRTQTVKAFDLLDDGLADYLPKR